MSCPQLQKYIRSLVATKKMFVAWSCTPCTMWTDARNFDKAHGIVIDIGMTCAEFTRKAISHCRKHQVLYQFENPSGSRLWHWQLLVRELHKAHAVHTTVYCRLGAPHRKSITPAGTFPISQLACSCQCVAPREVLRGVFRLNLKQAGPGIGGLSSRESVHQPFVDVLLIHSSAVFRLQRYGLMGKRGLCLSELPVWQPPAQLRRSSALSSFALSALKGKSVVSETTQLPSLWEDGLKQKTQPRCPLEAVVSSTNRLLGLLLAAQSPWPKPVRVFGRCASGGLPSAWPCETAYAHCLQRCLQSLCC